jgi:CRP/FNR family transcriptional regulator
MDLGSLGNPTRPGLEDPLTYLPRKPLQELARGQVVYDEHKPNNQLYAVMAGRVKVTTTSADGCEIVARIACAEALFGESCMVGYGGRKEAAATLENTTVMSWGSGEVEQYIDRDPRLGIALSQYVVRQCIDLQERVESMALHRTPERVMLSLITLAEDVGTPLADGSVRIGSLTHLTLAQYIGTSREIVTFQLNRLRRAGMLRYSRRFMDIHVPQMRGELNRLGVKVPRAAGGTLWRAVTP